MIERQEVKNKRKELGPAECELTRTLRIAAIAA